MRVLYFQTEVMDPVERKMTSEINAISSNLVDEILLGGEEERANEKAGEEEPCMVAKHDQLVGLPTPPTPPPSTIAGESGGDVNNSDSGHDSPMNTDAGNAGAGSDGPAANSEETDLSEEVARLTIASEKTPQQQSGVEQMDTASEQQQQEVESPKRVGSPLISDESEEVKEALLVPHHVEDVKGGYSIAVNKGTWVEGMRMVGMGRRPINAQ